MESRLAIHKDIRSFSRYPEPFFLHNSILDFSESVQLDSGVHTIMEGTHPIDIYLNFKPGKPLLVCLNGAQQRQNADKFLPRFTGFRVADINRVSHLCIADPSLYLHPEMHLAWYAGSKELPLQRLLPLVIEKIFKATESSQLIFVGGSGGGFASLFYSRLFEKSVAVVCNPQTDILKYYKPAVLKYANIAYGFESLDEINKHLPTIIESNLCDLYSESYSNFVFYMQNSADPHHINNHCIPFLTTLKSEAKLESQIISSNVYFHTANWGRGHITAPHPFWKHIIDSIADNINSLEELFCANEFPRIVSEFKSSM